MKNLVKSLLCLAVYFAVQMIVQIIFMMIGAATGILDQNGLIAFSMNHMLLVTLIANVVTVAFFVLYYIVRRRSVKTEWNMTPVKMKLYIYPAAAAFLLSSAWALVTGIVFVKTKSLYAAVVAHAFANLPDFVMPLLPDNDLFMVSWILL